MFFPSKTYWRMMFRFVLVIIVALGILYLSDLYLKDAAPNTPGDYLAVPEAGT